MSKAALTPKVPHIDLTIAELKRAWEKNPELRLGQLIFLIIKYSNKTSLLKEISNEEWPVIISNFRGDA